MGFLGCWGLGIFDGFGVFSGAFRAFVLRCWGFWTCFWGFLLRDWGFGVLGLGSLGLVVELVVVLTCWVWVLVA